MSLLRWQPWPEIDSMRRQLDQAVDELAHDALFQSVNTVVRVPAIELTRTAQAIVLKAELPGIAAQDLDIEVTRDAVSLKGTYRQASTDEHAQVYRTELRYGSFHRVVPLPVKVDNTAATAAFKNGILTLTLPQLTEVKPEAVKVTIADVPETTTQTFAPAAELTAEAAVESQVEPQVESQVEPQSIAHDPAIAPVAKTVAAPVTQTTAATMGDAWQ